MNELEKPRGLTLNDILKYISNGRWHRIDRIVDHYLYLPHDTIAIRHQIRTRKHSRSHANFDEYNQEIDGQFLIRARRAYIRYRCYQMVVHKSSKKFFQKRTIEQGEYYIRLSKKGRDKLQSLIKKGHITCSNEETSSNSASPQQPSASHSQPKPAPQPKKNHQAKTNTAPKPTHPNAKAMAYSHPATHKPSHTSSTKPSETKSSPSAGPSSTNQKANSTTPPSA